MTLYDIIRLNGLEPSEFRFLRHGYKEFNPLQAFQDDPDLFLAYQSFMAKRKFGDAKYIASFAPYHRTQGIFLGVWAIKNEVSKAKAPAEKRKLIKHFGWSEQGSYYELEIVDAFKDISERLIIEWGGSTVAWMQKKDKEVMAILPPAHVQEFHSYEQTLLSRKDLVKLVENPTGNATWYNALRAVNGIYCINDSSSGKIYVGSAYGKNGIWGRWADYVTTGHGGNKMLVERLRNEPVSLESFQYSILEILPGSSTPNDAVNKEILWKKKLGSRVHGYNDN